MAFKGNAEDMNKLNMQTLYLIFEQSFLIVSFTFELKSERIIFK